MDEKNKIDDLIVYAPDEEEVSKIEENPAVEEYNPNEEETQTSSQTEEADVVEKIEDLEEKSEGIDEEDTLVDDEELPDEECYPENEDDEEQFLERKSRKWLWILIAVLTIITVLLTVFKDTAFVKNYSENFSRNMAKLFPALFVEEVTDEDVSKDTTIVMEDEGGNAVVYKEFKNTTVTTDEATDTKYVFDTKKTYMVPYEGTADASIVRYDEGVVCGRVNSLSYIDAEGQIRWEIKTAIASPIVKSEGKYIAVAENGGNRISLYEGSKMLFDIDCPHKIKSCNVSSNGDVVLVVKKDGYIGGVSVYNRRGKEVFVWSSGQNDVLCADISSASRRVAVGLINADESVYSIIQIFDITKAEEGPAVRFDDTIIFDVDYSADVVTGYGDNSMVCMTSTGRVIIDRRYNEVEIAHKANDYRGNKIVLFDSNNIPIVQTYNRKGTIKSEVVIEELADCIDIDDDYFIYNTGRDVIMRKGNHNRVRIYTATMDILGLYIIDSKTFIIVHSNSLEIVKLS